MTAAYNPAEAERLVREAREDDRKMAVLEGHKREPWRAVEATRKDIGRLRHYVTCIPADHACWSGNDMVAWSRLGIWTSDGVTEQAFAEGIARSRNNLPAMADQLDAARIRIAELEGKLRSRIEHAALRGRGDAERIEQQRRRITELESAPSTTSDLTACEEQRDVYRDRAQHLANRVTDLTTALRSLIARVRRTGGYASPEEQAALWEAERVLG